MRLVPAFLDPGRSRPAGDLHAGFTEQVVHRYLFECDVPTVGGESPPRADDRRREQPFCANFHWHRWRRCAADGIPRRFNTVHVVQVIGVIGRHRIGMEDETGRLFLAERRQNSARGSAAAVGGSKGRGGRVERDNQKRSQRPHRLHMRGHRPGEDRHSAHIRMQRLVNEALARGRWIDRVDAYLVRIIGRKMADRMTGTALAASDEDADSQDRAGYSLADRPIETPVHCQNLSRNRKGSGRVDETRPLLR